jgi:hypothetical protein
MLPCHSGLARTLLVDGADSIRIWTVAVNVLNKQLRTREKVSVFIVELGSWANKMINNVS